MKLKLIIESHFEPFLNEETNPRETESKKKWVVVNMVLSLKFNQLSCKYIKMLCQCYSFNFEHRIQCAPKTQKPYSCFVCICIVLVICSREIFQLIVSASTYQVNIIVNNKNVTAFKVLTVTKDTASCRMFFLLL